MGIQASLNLVVPTGEVSYRYEPSEHAEGVYYALSYRKKRVCIDSGLLPILEAYLRAPMDQRTFDDINHALWEFTKDYSALWWRCQRTGEFLKVTKITVSAVGRDTLVLTPHYEVPNEVRDPRRVESDQHRSRDPGGETAGDSLAT